MSSAEWRKVKGLANIHFTEWEEQRKRVESEGRDGGEHSGAESGEQTPGLEDHGSSGGAGCSGRAGQGCPLVIFGNNSGYYSIVVC